LQVKIEQCHPGLRGLAQLHREIDRKAGGPGATLGATDRHHVAATIDYRSFADQLWPQDVVDGVAADRFAEIFHGAHLHHGAIEADIAVVADQHHRYVCRADACEVFEGRDRVIDAGDIHDGSAQFAIRLQRVDRVTDVAAPHIESGSLQSVPQRGCGQIIIDEGDDLIAEQERPLGRSAHRDDVSGHRPLLS
jgi:hypothetical protein